VGAHLTNTTDTYIKLVASPSRKLMKPAQVDITLNQTTDGQHYQSGSARYQHRQVDNTGSQHRQVAHGTRTDRQTKAVVSTDR
jgi:hypothetical protein